MMIQMHWQEHHRDKGMNELNSAQTNGCVGSDMIAMTSLISIRKHFKPLLLACDNITIQGCLFIRDFNGTSPFYDRFDSRMMEQKKGFAPLVSRCGDEHLARSGASSDCICAVHRRINECLVV